MQIHSPVPFLSLQAPEGCASGYASPLQRDRVEVNERLMVQRVSGGLEGVRPFASEHAPNCFYALSSPRETRYLGEPLELRAPREPGAFAQLSAVCDTSTQTARAGYEEFLVVERIVAAKLTAKQMQDTCVQTKLFELLSKAHAQPANAHTLVDYNLAGSTQQALEALYDSTKTHPLCHSALRQFVAEQQAILAAQPQDEVVVHGDVWHDNILTDPNGRLWLVGWGLAHLGDPLEDIVSPLIRADVTLDEEEAILGLVVHRLQVPDATQRRFSAIMGLLEVSYYAHQASSGGRNLDLPSLETLAARLQQRSGRDLAGREPTTARS